MAFNALCFLLFVFSLSSVVSASVTFRNELDSRSTSHQNTRKSQIISQLGPQLSSGAAITDANNGNLALATQRWQTFDNPNFFAAVQVASEADIIKTVCIQLLMLNSTLRNEL